MSETFAEKMARKFDDAAESKYGDGFRPNGTTKHIPEESKNLPSGLAKAIVELDDEICGLFGQDSHMLWDIPEGPKRDSAIRHLERVLNKIRKIEEDYGIDN